MPMDRSDWERLKELQEEIRDHVEEAKNLIRCSGDRMEYERAKAYWLSHMEYAIDKVNPYDKCTMEDTIKALEPHDEEEESGIDNDSEERRRQGLGDV